MGLILETKIETYEDLMEDIQTLEFYSSKDLYKEEHELYIQINKREYEPFMRFNLDYNQALYLKNFINAFLKQKDI